MAKLIHIFRHPVKGLRPEALEFCELKKEAGLVGDRSFAFQFFDDKLPPELREQLPESAPWLVKFYLANQHDWPDLAKLSARYDVATKTLSIKDEIMGVEVSGNPSTVFDRKKLEIFVEAFLKDKQAFERARHPEKTPLRLLGSEALNTRYTDGQKGPLSIAFMESLRDLEKHYGVPLDIRRFRINFILEGAPAWSELGWAGSKLKIGQSEIQIKKAIARCPNIDVDPETGSKEIEIFSELKTKLGHSFFGVRAEILKEGSVHVGDTWQLLS